MGPYKREGFHRLGVLLGSLAVIGWTAFFIWKFEGLWSRVIETQQEEYVSGSSPPDLCAERLDAQAPTPSSYEQLLGLVVGDPAFRNLTPEQQNDVFEYLARKHGVHRVLVLTYGDGVESDLAHRLGRSQLHVDQDDLFWVFRLSDLHTKTRRRWVFRPIRLLTLCGGLVVGCFIAFAVLWALVASVGWVIEGFRELT